MRLSSPLQARKYLTSVKMRMSGHFDHHERFTGFFLGSFFHITHHAEYEWDRRYKSPKNAAVGYIKQTADGCEVRFFLARGLLCPAQFLGFFLFFCVVLTSMLACSPHWSPPFLKARQIAAGKAEKHYWQCLKIQRIRSCI